MDDKQRISKLEGDVANLNTRMAVAEAGIKDMKDDMESIKNNTTWILRLIIGAIVMALLGLVLVNGGSI
ncbi:hemolysin XhlA [Ureibacillus xyleni]|uniref:Hemolysin XhlA n=1 Tax=Ureibacillus xyleni TaxID=614648 RepID=A0A285SWP5_9BACL|nr:hemolysin XhlA family protein [Ureibacillus xyleni]SOC12761.1 hemolysin XhlA [Ureibacillus xyleni]